ncbi:hypothetical protein HAX54_050764, partial [Datura stramonium]|nr:hypothetical protein [Datura stramonium]
MQRNAKGKNNQNIFKVAKAVSCARGSVSRRRGPPPVTLRDTSRPNMEFLKIPGELPMAPYPAEEGLSVTLRDT